MKYYYIITTPLFCSFLYNNFLRIICKFVLNKQTSITLLNNGFYLGLLIGLLRTIKSNK